MKYTSRGLRKLLNDPERRIRLFRELPASPFDRLLRLATSLSGIPAALLCLRGEDAYVQQATLAVSARQATAYCESLDHLAPLATFHDAEHLQEIHRPNGTADLPYRYMLRREMQLQGEAFGTFILLDEQPRTLSEATRAELEDIAQLLLHEVERFLESYLLVESEAALRRTTRRYRKLMDGAAEGILITRPRTTIIRANERICQMLGYTREEIEGMRPEELVVDPDDAEAEAIWRAILHGETISFERLARRKDGSSLPVEIQASLVEKDLIQAFVRDISKRHEAEATKHRLAALVDSSQDAILSTDLEGTITSWNAAAEMLYGYAAQEAIGKPISIIVPPDQEDELERIFAKVRAGEITRHLDTKRRRADGTHLDISLTISPIRDAEGRTVGISGIERDIAERKVAESESRLLATIVHCSQDAIVGKDLEGRITSWNDAAKALYGYTEEEALGEPFDELLVPPAKQDEFDELHSAAARGQGASAVETVRITKTGLPVQISLSLSPIRDADGRIIGSSASARDIGKRKDAEQRLVERERQLSTLIENLPGIVYRVRNEPKWTVEFISEGVRELTGYPVSSFSGKEAITWADLVVPADLGRIAEEVDAALRAERGFEIEYRLQTADGRERWIWEKGQGVRDPGGEMTHIEGFIIDVTERRRVDKELREHRERLQLALEAASMGIWDYEVETGEVRWTDQTAEVYGIKPDDFGGTIEDVLHLVHPHDLPQLEHAIEKALASGGEFLTEHRTVRPDGRVAWIAGRGHALRSEERPTRLIGTAMDISRAKEREARLRESEERWRKLVDNNPVALLINVADEIAYINQAGAELVGVNEPADLEGWRVSSLLAAEDRARYEGRRQNGNEQRVNEPTLYQLEHRGQTRYVKAFSVPIVYEGKPAALTVAHDVTAQRRHEQGLIEAKERAEEMSRLKGAFLANMSHEIRTPLTGIIGFADVLADLVTPDCQEYVGMIQRSGERLMETLTSVLDLAQLESGSMQMKHERVVICRFIEHNVELFEARAEEKGLQLETELPETPILTYTDSTAVHRILNNLLSNAIKFTDEGSVEVSVTEVDDEIMIKVADTGTGIDEAFLPKLFEPYQQESSGLSRNFEGSGLGLTITQRLVELIDGTITVESEKGTGSTFRVLLPLT